jgi:hypothetical protein
MPARQSSFPYSFTYSDFNTSLYKFISSNNRTIAEKTVGNDTEGRRRGLN